MSRKNALYNDILQVIKNSNVEVGEVCATLNQIEQAVSIAASSATRHMSIDEISDQLKERPRE